MLVNYLYLFLFIISPKATKCVQNFVMIIVAPKLLTVGILTSLVDNSILVLNL